MRKLFFTFIFFAGSMALLQAQLPIANFPDFDHPDVKGQQHHFYQYLEEGKIVVPLFLDMWNNTCLERAAAFNEVWERHGPDGDNTTIVVGLESTPNGSDADVATFPADYPMINTIKGCSDKPNCGLPHYYVVCPDGYWTKVDAADPADLADAFTQAINNCPVFDSDAAVLSIDRNYVVCDGQISPKVNFYNRGKNALTSAVFMVKLNGVVQTFFPWSGNLAQFGTQDVVIPAFSAPTESGAYELSIEVSSPNGVIDQQSGNNKKISSVYIINPAEAENMTLEVEPDFYPEEVVWQITTQDGTVVLGEGKGYNGAFTQALCARKGECYTLHLYDEGFDGFESGGGAVYQNGYKVFDFTSDNHQFGYSKFDFCMSAETVSGNGPTETGGSPQTHTGIIGDIQNTAITFVRTQQQIYIDSEVALQGANVQIYDMKGSIMQKEKLNIAQQIDISTLSSGVYVLHLQHSQGDATYKFSVLK